MEGAVTDWTSSDVQVATVSETGLVTAVGNGTAVIGASAGGASAEANVVVAQVPDTVVVSPGSVVLSGPGDTLRVSAVVRDQGGSLVSGSRPTWSVADGNVATIDADGLVTAVTVGATAVSATSGALTTSVAVTVTVTPASIVVSPDAVALTSLGERVAITADVRDGNGEPIAGAGVVWASTDPAVVTVVDGVLTSTGVGGTEVVATAGSVADTVSVTVIQEPASILVSPSSVVLNGIGDMLTLDAAILDAGGSPIPGEVITWATSDPGIVTVSSAGSLTAAGQGQASVEAASGALSTTVWVTVTSIPASIEVTPDTLLLGAPDDTATVTGVVRDSNGQVIAGASIRWASDDTTVATVSGAGLVRAVRLGATTIIAEAGDQVATIAVVVGEQLQAPSFAEAVNPIFVSRGCTAGNCHGGGAGNMTLGATASTSYTSLVGVPAFAEPTLLRVKPGDAQASYLVIKLEGRQSSGARMPLGGAPLSAAEIKVIRDWIDLGAPNN